MTKLWSQITLDTIVLTKRKYKRTQMAHLPTLVSDENVKKKQHEKK